MQYGDKLFGDIFVSSMHTSELTNSSIWIGVHLLCCSDK